MENCRFCQIINSQREGEEVVFENEKFVVLTDKYRRTSVGAICLLIPKQHVGNLLELPKDLDGELTQLLKFISISLQKTFNCKGIRIWTAINREAGQSIFHFHIHILPCSSIFDRLIAAVPGIYDVIRKVMQFGENKLSKTKHYEDAERIRKTLNQKI